MTMSPDKSDIQLDGNSAQSGIDLRFMQAAIRFARRHAGITGTNPSVACLIVADDPNGNGEGNNYWIAGRGVTAIGGRPHAEPVALEQAGRHAKGATAYVTLEPCAHHGITAPCATTLIESGVSRVVTAQRDPDGRVNSKGFRMLRDAGIEVVENIAVQKAAWELRGYLSRKSGSRPWVVLKLAVTADGYLGLSGRQVAITGATSNAQTHLLRARSDAILIGSGTVISDDPSLTCRLPGLTDRSPVRIAVEHTRPVPVAGKFIDLASSVETYIACPQQNLKNRKNQLERTACKFITCDSKNNEIALPELLTDLADIGVSFLMVEGGRKISKAFLENQLVDEIILYTGEKKLSEITDLKPGDTLIPSPVMPDTITEGFHLSAEWKYGSDKVVRFVRS